MNKNEDSRAIESFGIPGLRLYKIPGADNESESRDDAEYCNLRQTA